MVDTGFLSQYTYSIPREPTQETQKSETVRRSPIISYLDEIPKKDKFKYIIVILVFMLFSYRLNLHWSIWIGLPIGLLYVYYTNERNALELNNESDKIWNVLKGSLLRDTKYFVTDPSMISWVNDVGEFKKYNVLEFNNMIKSMDRFLKLEYDIKTGVYKCKENLDLIRDLKTNSLNQFHTIVYKIDNADMRKKFNVYYERLGDLLNVRYLELIKICKNYYNTIPVNIESGMDVVGIEEPNPNDKTNDPHYNFYN